MANKLLTTPVFWHCAGFVVGEMGFRESLEQEYGTQDLYEALGLSKDCKESEIKRAYHKLSLKVHPDRVDPGEIEEATRKFQV